MAMSPAELRKSGTTAVSNYFRHDWQFIVDYLRTPLLKEASTAIAAAPAVLDLSFIGQHAGSVVSKAIAFTFVAAVTYIFFYIFGYLSCPKFIREYRDFGDYSKRQHSNRFIGWELVNALRLTRDDKVIDELVEKGLVTEIDPSDTSKILATGLKHEAIGKYTILGPNNVDVDLYVYFRCGASMYRLWLKDDKIDAADTTQRNLFWVIYTRLTKSRPIRRYVTWGLFNIAIAIFLGSVVVSVYRSLG